MKKILLLAVLALGLCVCSCGKSENEKRIEQITKYDLPALMTKMKEEAQKSMEELKEDNEGILKAAIQLGINHPLVLKRKAEAKERLDINNAKTARIEKKINNLYDTLSKLNKELKE